MEEPPKKKKKKKKDKDEAEAEAEEPKQEEMEVAATEVGSFGEEKKTTRELDSEKKFLGCCTNFIFCPLQSEKKKKKKKKKTKEEEEDE